MQLERIRAVTVGRILLQILGEIDDADRFERALLDADTAAC